MNFEHKSLSLTKVRNDSVQLCKRIHDSPHYIVLEESELKELLARIKEEKLSIYNCHFCKKIARVMKLTHQGTMGYQVECSTGVDCYGAKQLRFGYEAKEDAIHAWNKGNCNE